METKGMEVVVASMCHAKYAQAISQEIEKSAQVRKTGIALRSPEYLQEKIKSKHAVVSIDILKGGNCWLLLY